MAYINTQTLQYPLSETDIRFANPNTSYAQPFAPGEPYAWVFPAPTPTVDPTAQGFRQTSPVLTAGQWYESWEVYDLSPEQVAANQAAAAKALQDGIVQQTQQRLDDFARTRNYDGILSLCTYATSAVPKFQAEGQYGVNARDMTWAKLYEILGEVQAGTRPMPSGYADIESELPVLTWPN